MTGYEPPSDSSRILHLATAKNQLFALPSKNQVKFWLKDDSKVYVPGDETILTCFFRLQKFVNLIGKLETLPLVLQEISLLFLRLLFPSFP